MRRFTRLTNAFSKKVENLARGVAALHELQLRPAHATLTKDAGGYKITPTMAAGAERRVWTHRATPHYSTSDVRAYCRSGSPAPAA
jgi:hypothetical protein